MISAFAPTPENAYKITENADSPPDSLSFPTTSKADESKGPHTPLDEEHHAMIIPGTSRHMLRRRRSHLQRWIEDQHYITQGDSTDIFELSEDLETPIAAVGTPCNPYLAYPHLAVGSFRSSTMDEVGSMHNYVVVDDTVDEDADEDADHVSVDSEGAEHMSPPASPAIDLFPQKSPSSKIRPPSSLRNFHLSFRSTRAPSISMEAESSSSRNSSRLSLFRSPRASTSTARGYKHTKSSSLSTLNLSRPGISSSDSLRNVPPNTSQTWRWRPSVLGHFSSSPAVPHANNLSAELQPPRPSMSSTNTGYSSVMTPPTAYENEAGALPSTPPNTVLLNSVRSRRKSPKHPLFRNGPGTASVPSLWSGHTSVSHTPDTSMGSGLIHKESAIHIGTFSPKRNKTPLPPTSDDEAQTPIGTESLMPQIVYPVSRHHHMPRVSMASLSVSMSERRKKKLVVSGIASNDARRFEAMKNWCETFGEVTQIIRMPNSDLHVHFRKAEVAETVCRVRAKVTIAGVGSVQLSWYTGDRR